MANDPSHNDPSNNAYRSDREAALAHAASLQQRNAHLETENAALRAENAALRADNDRMRPYAPGAPPTRRTGVLVAIVAVVVFVLGVAAAFLTVSRPSAPPSFTTPTSVSVPPVAVPMIPTPPPVPTPVPTPNLAPPT